MNYNMNNNNNNNNDIPFTSEDLDTREQRNTCRLTFIVLTIVLIFFIVFSL